MSPVLILGHPANHIVEVGANGGQRELQNINESDDRNSCFYGFSGKVSLQDAVLFSFVLLVLLQVMLITQIAPG